MEQLDIYYQAEKLFYSTYELIAKNTALNREFAIRDQLKRASLSVFLNIAEGSKLPSKWSRRYLFIASVSNDEVCALLRVINTLFDIDISALADEYAYLGRRITALRKKL